MSSTKDHDYQEHEEAGSRIPYGPRQEPWGEQVPTFATVTAPAENPIPVYPDVPPPEVEGDFPELDSAKFELSPDGLSPREQLTALAELERFIKTQHINFTGFQVNEDLDFQSLSWLLDIHTNNVGDPFSSGYVTLNTKLIERSVLDYFAALWNAEWPHRDADDTADEVRRYADRYWGYVLSMGSTEGNLYGVYNARNYLNGGMLMHGEDTKGSISRLNRGKMTALSGQKLLAPRSSQDDPKHTPVAFYSEDAHYSVVKAMNVMQVKTFYEVGMASGKPCPINGGVWPQEVPSRDYTSDPRSGSIIVEDLEKLLRFFLDEGYPPLIILNEGSTWKGAYDDVEQVNEMLTRLGEEYPWLWEREVEYEDEDGKKLIDTRRGFWLHIDGALGGAYLPFFEMAYNRGEITTRPVVFDFRNTAVMSICCSMHKWIGGPWPGGIYMTKTRYQLKPPATAGYIGSPDTTLGGSRNAFSPVLFWLYFARMSYEQNMKKAVQTERVAEYLETKLRDLESHLKKTEPDADLWIHRSQLSLAVTFRMVNPTIAYTFTVDGERLMVPVGDGECEERSFAHIYSMQSLGAFDIVDQFIAYVQDICDHDGWKTAFPEAAKETIDGKPNPGGRKKIEP